MWGSWAQSDWFLENPYCLVQVQLLSLTSRWLPCSISLSSSFLTAHQPLPAQAGTSGVGIKPEGGRLLAPTNKEPEVKSEPLKATTPDNPSKPRPCLAEAVQNE